MQLSKIMFAVATLAIGASALAGPTNGRIAISAGASATRGNLLTALTNLCVAATGKLSTISSGSNFPTHICAKASLPVITAASYSGIANSDFVNFNGTSYAEVRLNTEGSFSAVLLLNGVPVSLTDPATGTTVTTQPAGSVRVGGLLDVEPTAFPSSTIGANTLFPTTAAGFAQTFGIGVTKPLYDAMFADQKAAGVIPASCNLADTGVSACVPSIGKAQMATIMADNSFNPAYAGGAGFLAPSLGNADLRYIRRVDNSGTQAAAQNYFLGLPCAKASLSIVPEPTGQDEAGGLKDVLLDKIRVLAAPGTSDVVAELNKVGSNYGIGVISGENDKSGSNFYWLRVGGAPMTQNAKASTAGNTATATMLNGSYDFYYESVYMGGSAAGDAFWSTVSGALNSLVLPVGLVNATQLAGGYNKGGLTCAASASN